MKVTLYTKAECGLCEEAEVMLRRLQRVYEFEIEFVDVEADKSLNSTYGERVPVVRIGDEEAAAPLDEGKLRALLGR